MPKDMIVHLDGPDLVIGNARFRGTLTVGEMRITHTENSVCVLCGGAAVAQTLMPGERLRISQRGDSGVFCQRC